ncbi:MAG: DUF362 domain-containing protein [Thermodesulfobacteriota bacterium]
MPAKVYFADFRARSFGENKVSKLKKLFEKAGLSSVLAKGDLTAVKMHFGEVGNDTFLSPVLVRAVVDKIRETGAKPFLTDTGTLYTGKRKNAADHINTAISHGFAYSVVNAPVIIADGLKGDSVVSVEINKKRFSKVKIARDIVNADSMIVLSHVKGHELAGFGGAIKNLAMGCAPPMGKKEQHSARFFVNEEKCIACGECEKNCPTGAAQLSSDFSTIDKDRCIGCGECVTVCPEKAIDMDWATDIAEFMERMTEYALGAVIGKPGKVAYVNFIMNVTPDCDCIPWSDAPIVPDVGVLASFDPVAIDKASWDLVNQQQGNAHSHIRKNLDPGGDKFTGLWSYTKPGIAITHGAEIGLGSPEYELVKI